MKRCINCDCFFSCEKANEEKEQCEDFIKAERKTTKLESKKGIIFEFKEIK